MPALDVLIWISLVIGAAASVAALWGYYGELPGWLTGPEVCAMEGGGCAILFRTSRAALLGIPNASLGVLLYALLAVALLNRWPGWVLVLMVTPAVAMSAFLGWSLLSRGLQCRICWAGHAANFTLLGCILVRTGGG